MTNLALLGGSPVLTQPLRPYRTIGTEEQAAVNRVLASGTLSGFFGSWGDEFFGGPEIRKLEAEWARTFGVNHAVTVNSNTSGLIAAMGAIGLGPGDEVIVPPTTMSASAVAPLFYGGVPVFVDIEPDTFCLDAVATAAAITPNTRAILAVNLFGQPADLIELRALADSRGLYLIEDNAQAPFATQNGRLTGTIGHIGVFSLNYHKHFHAGEGGVCTTDDDRLADRLRMIRNHGENVAEVLGGGDLTNLIGFNFRMTEMSAAVGIEQLKKAVDLVAERVAAAERLSAQIVSLSGIQPPRVRAECRHSYYVWALRFDERTVGVSRAIFSKALAAEGVPHSTGYVRPLYHLPVFRNRIAIGQHGFPFTARAAPIVYEPCPVAERLYREEFLLIEICSFELTEADIDLLVAAFHKVYDHRAMLAKATLAAE
jgi:perosamine synthetase